MKLNMAMAYVLVSILSAFGAGWYTRDTVTLEKDIRARQLNRDIGKTQVQLKILESNLHPDFRAMCYFMTVDFE